MDRHRSKLVFAGVAGLVIPFAALAWGAQDALPKDFSFASLGDFFGSSSNPPHPEAVVLHLDLDTPDPRVMAFDRDYGNSQGEINDKQDMLAARGRLVYGVDIPCLDVALDGIDLLQEDLDKIYLEYIALVNAQGGMISEAQDLEFREKCQAIRAKIQARLYEAESIANGSTSNTCA
jgi:hypothetical protein